MTRLPVHGFIEFNNGIIIAWLRFATSEEEAVRVATAQNGNVARCWVA